MNTGLTIGQVARRAGMNTSAIRFYEKIGLVAPTRRVSGQRRYDPPVVERLSAIRAARALGFSLPEIGGLLDGFDTSTPPSARWQALAAEKLPQIDAEIARLMALKRLLEAGSGCECSRVEVCLGAASS